MPRTIPLKFGGDPDHCLFPGFFQRIIHCEICYVMLNDATHVTSREVTCEVIHIGSNGYLYFFPILIVVNKWQLPWQRSVLLVPF